MARRWVMVIVAVCLVATVAAIAYAAGKTSAPEVIRAQRFEVVDEKGVVRAMLYVSKLVGGGVALGLRDENGKMRASFSVSDLGPANLTLADEQGMPRIAMTVHGPLTSVQLLSGKMMRPVSEVLPGGKGSEREVWKAAEKAFPDVEVRAMLLMDDETDKAAIALFDEKGELIWNVGLGAGEQTQGSDDDGEK